MSLPLAPYVARTAGSRLQFGVFVPPYVGVLVEGWLLLGKHPQTESKANSSAATGGGVWSPAV